MLTAKIIRQRRLASGLNQEKFAETLGISRQHLSKIERGLSISKKIETRFVERYGDKPVLPVSSSRGVDCPFCHTFENPTRVDIGGIENDAMDCVYHCPNCKRVFTTRESWHLAQCLGERKD